MTQNEKKKIQDAIDAVLREEKPPTEEEKQEYKDEVLLGQRIQERVNRELGQKYVALSYEFNFNISGILVHFLIEHNADPVSLLTLIRILLEENEAFYLRTRARKNQINK